MIVGVCLTNARPMQLANAIACWEMQDVEGERLLIVLDDDSTTHPAKGETWQILSTPRRFPTLGSKRRAAVAIAIQRGATEIVVWDDDDVYRAHHVRASIEALRAGGDLSIPGVILSDYQESKPDRVHAQISGNRHHGGWSFTAAAYLRSGGYDRGKNSGEDQELLRAFRATGARIVDPTERHAPGYLYRWTWSGSPHVSTQGYHARAAGESVMVRPVLQQDWEAVAQAAIGAPGDWLAVKERVIGAALSREGKPVPGPGPTTAPPPEPVKVKVAGIVVPPPRRVRIGMLSPCWAVGGVERQFVAMAQEIKSVEWAGIVATGEPFERNAIEEAMRICPVEQGGEIEVRRLLERCDAVIAWGNLDARHWFEGWKGSLILVAHGTGQYTRERMADLADLAAYRVAVSEAAVATFPEQFRPTVRVVHNGFEYGHVRARGVRSRDQVRAAWKIPDGKLVIGYCGRFSIEKNPTAAAMAAAALGWEYCVAVYQVPGWSRPDALSALPGAFPGGDFRFPGETPTAVQEFLAGVDVLILASREEGFSMAMVEAWASRTPVVSTVVGAIEEVERDHGRVVVRVPHNPTGEDLAAAVEEALSDEFREGPVENAYRVAWDSLTAQSMARRWNDVFREIPLRV